jgi:2-hydroxy-6-oxonona-2,4-dienedioate hydrolase
MTTIIKRVKLGTIPSPRHILATAMPHTPLTMNLNFNNPKDEIMDFIKIQGYRIRYIKFSNSKSKETIVLLHGLGASAERWSELFPLLTKNYNIIVPDIMGFGYSEKPLIHYNMDIFIRFLDEFFQKLEIKNPIGIGSSFGGQLILEYYFKNKNFFKKIILVSPAGTHETPTSVFLQYIFSSLYPTIENTKRSFETMASKNYKVQDSVVKDFVNRMKSPNAKYALTSTLLALKKDITFSDKIKDIKIPTLVIWGSEDNFIPIENLDYFKNINSIETCIMEGCGHSPFVEKPLSFYNIVNNFISNIKNLYENHSTYLSKCPKKLNVVQRHTPWRLRNCRKGICQILS